MSLQDVGAIGELLGAIGVLITLIYFGVQLRKTQNGLLVTSLSSAQQSDLILKSKLEENADLVCRANGGQELSETEKYRLEQILLMANSTAFYGFLRSASIGVASEQVLFLNFASFLKDNPAFRRRWEKLEEKVERRRAHLDVSDGPRWVEGVKSALHKLDETEGN